MIVLAIAAILLAIVRPNIIGFGEASNETAHGAFDNIGDALGSDSDSSSGDESGSTTSTSCDGTCKNSCRSGESQIRGSCPSGQVCCR